MMLSLVIVIFVLLAALASVVFPVPYKKVVNDLSFLKTFSMDSSFRYFE